MSFLRLSLLVMLVALVGCQRDNGLAYDPAPPSRTTVGNGGHDTLGRFLESANQLLDQLESSQAAQETLSRENLTVAKLRPFLSPRFFRMTRTLSQDKYQSEVQALAGDTVELREADLERLLDQGRDLRRLILHETFRLYAAHATGPKLLDDDYRLSDEILRAVGNTRIFVSSSPAASSEALQLSALLPVASPVVGKLGCDAESLHVHFDFEAGIIELRFSGFELGSELHATGPARLTTAFQCEIFFVTQPGKIGRVVLEDLSSGRALKVDPRSHIEIEARTRFNNLFAENLEGWATSRFEPLPLVSVGTKGSDLGPGLSLKITGTSPSFPKVRRLSVEKVRISVAPG